MYRDLARASLALLAWKRKDEVGEVERGREGEGKGREGREGEREVDGGREKGGR